MNVAVSPKENWIGEIIRPPATGRLRSVFLCTALAPCIMPNSRNFKSMSSLPPYPLSKTMRTVRTDLVDEMKPSESFWSSHNNHRRTSPFRTTLGLLCQRSLTSSAVIYNVVICRRFCVRIKIIRFCSAPPGPPARPLIGEAPGLRVVVFFSSTTSLLNISHIRKVCRCAPRAARRLSCPSSGENDGGFSIISYPRHGRPFNRCLWSTGLEKSPGKLQHSPPFIIPSPGSVHALSSKCLVPIQTGSLGEKLTRADIEVEALLPAPKLLGRPTVLSSHIAPQCFLASSQRATKHLSVEFAKTIDALLTDNPKIYSPQSNTPDESPRW